jgi:hypothetical protein
MPVAEQGRESMSRAGYSDDYCDDPLAAGRWRGAILSAIRGERGQKFLRDLRDALDAMPVKRLISGALKEPTGEVCAIGSLGIRRGVDMSPLLKPDDCDQEDWDSDWECEADERAEILSSMFDVAPCLAREVMFQNDECDQWHHEVTGAVIHSFRGERPPIRYDNPEERWVRMRKWVAKKLGETWLPPSEGEKPVT